MKRALLLFILCLFGSCQQREKSLSPNGLTINLKDEPQTLDPRQIRDTNGVILMKMFFEGLTRLNLANMPELALAQGIEVSEDLKTYTFYLREAYWSNGDPVEAEDFIYTWKKSLDPGFRADLAFQLYPIKNAREVKLGKKFPETLGLRALNTKTLVIELEYPLPYFLELTTSPIFFPINRHVDQENPHWSKEVQNYVCNGPFKLIEWKHHYFLSAKKNSSYWDAAWVHLDQIAMTMVPELTELELYETRKLDWVGSPLSRLPLDALESLKKQFQVYQCPLLGTSFVQANVAQGILSHQKLRYALAFALDRKEIASELTNGTQLVAGQFVPPTFGLPRTPYFLDGNQEKARAFLEHFLEEAGLTRATLPTIVLTYASNEQSRLIVQALQDQWRRVLGITIQLDGVEKKVFFDRLSHEDYEMAYRDWIADYNDPINFLEIFKYKQQSTNHSGWENPAYTQLLDDSFQCADLQKRKELLAEAEKILLEAMPIIPLLHYQMHYLKDEQLEGIFLSPLGHLDFKWAYWKNAP